MRTVSAGNYLPSTTVLAGSKRSRTVLAEGKYDGQSLQEAKISGFFYTLWCVSWLLSAYGCVKFSEQWSPREPRVPDKTLQRFFFHISQQKPMLCPSLEPAQQDVSNEGSQLLFLLRNIENYPCYIFLSGAARGSAEQNPWLL